jgi:hypothetical protein
MQINSFDRTLCATYFSRELCCRVSYDVRFVTAEVAKELVEVDGYKVIIRISITLI